MKLLLMHQFFVYDTNRCLKANKKSVTKENYLMKSVHDIIKMIKTVTKPKH